MADNRKILVIDGHPDRNANHFCHALAQSYRQGAEAGGHTVDVVRIADLDFPILRSASDYDTAPGSPSRTAAAGRDFCPPLWKTSPAGCSARIMSS